MLLLTSLKHLDRTRNISVSTFREEDIKGIAPRAQPEMLQKNEADDRR
ncbi:MAG: hypothetical protein K0R92_3543 [Lachnospiraceae bacterium]|nr:hypothetical protein [Lachnospiraceae bacterium]